MRQGRRPERVRRPWHLQGRPHHEIFPIAAGRSLPESAGLLGATAGVQGCRAARADARVHACGATAVRGTGRAAAPGGQTTVHATGRNAFSLPAANLDDAERTRFVIGNSFFKRNWVQAPASTTARDGLGPHFLARSCGGCHVQDGRAQPPDFHNPLKPQPFAGLLMRLSIPGEGPHGSPVPDPVYGDQFNTEGVLGVKGEGQLRIRYEQVHGRFADGTAYTLEKPVYELAALNYGPWLPT